MCRAKRLSDSNSCCLTCKTTMLMSDFNRAEFKSEWRCAESSLISNQARCDYAPRRVQPASPNKANSDSGRVRGSNIFVLCLLWAAGCEGVVFPVRTAVQGSPCVGTVLGRGGFGWGWLVGPLPPHCIEVMRK